MNHPEEGNPEETSKEETSEEMEKEELEEKEEEIIVPQEEEVQEEWTCDICDEPQLGDSFKIDGYHEDICGQCYDRGLMWCIREAWKWRSQIRIDVLRKPKDE